MAEARESRPGMGSRAADISRAAETVTSVVADGDAKPMTVADRSALRSLVAKRAKLEKAGADAHGKQLIANGDAEMSRQFKIEDLGIERVFEETRAQVEQLAARMNARLDALGVAAELRPQVELMRTSGGYYGREHRGELRRKMRVEVDAAVKRRHAEIDAWEYEQLAAIAAATVQSDVAREIMAGLPDVAEALPAVEDLIGPVETQPLAVIESTREAKRLAVLAELGSDASRSDRQIGRLLGVDHKTVGKLRAVGGEVPGDGGEVSGEGGELPTADVGDPR